MKNPFFSKTILGIIAMVAAMLLNQAGIDVENDAMVTMLDEGLFALGSIIAVYGRVKADGKIGFKK